MRLLINYRFSEYLLFPFKYGFKYYQNVYVFGSGVGFKDKIFHSYILGKNIGFYGGLISKGTKPINPNVESRYKYFKRVYLNKF